MRRKKPFAAALALTLAALLLLAVPANAAVFTFETQFEYDRAQLGWLTDLDVKEDMESIPGAVAKNRLKATPPYPYTETAETFSEDVANYLELYTLKKGSLRASYVFLLDLLGSNANVFAAQVSDEAARAYLENVGIVFPASADDDTRLMAKALYAALITGAYDGLTGEELRNGVSLEKALIRYVSSLSGLRKADVDRFAPDGAASLSSYLLASSRYTLWANGYDVNENTSEDRVSDLVAVMTVKSLGVSVNEDLSFEELKSVYAAALLGKKYNVTFDPAVLSTHVNNGTVPFYVLQLLGRKYGLTVREDSMRLTEAFNLIAKNTGVFDVEEDEFYADIYDYTYELSGKRTSVWVYPTSYAGTDDAAFVSITVNGKNAPDGEFTRVPIDPDKKEQKLTVRVEATRYAETDVKTYTVTLRASDAPAGTPGETPAAPVYENADSIVTQIMKSIGVNDGVVKATDRLIAGLPGVLRTSMDFIAPTFGDEAPENAEAPDAADPGAPFDASSFLQILDRLGAAGDAQIAGVDGIALIRDAAKNADFNLISFGR